MRETTIGIDTHIGKSNYYAMDREGGGLLGVGEFKTSAQNFIMSVNKFPQPRTVIIEQGPMAEWIKRVLEPKFAKVILAPPKQNSWIAKDRNKNDEVDTKKLACLYGGGFIKEIQTRSVAKAELITYVIHTHGLVKQMVRIKNQLSAKFRQQGIRKRGAGAYEAEKISQDLCLMDSGQAMQEAILQMRSQLELLERQKMQVKSRLQKLSEGFGGFPRSKLFGGIFRHWIRGGGNFIGTHRYT
jgi:transposase